MLDQSRGKKTKFVFVYHNRNKIHCYVRQNLNGYPTGSLSQSNNKALFLISNDPVYIQVMTMTFIMSLLKIYVPLIFIFSANS